ncbi:MULTISPECIES: DNA starvation/stationary phase protection protein [unclassified Sphingopyxis]|jgi:starvation-inducible DNA-binding protein|uniref:Dps family protein n=1 Tax=unclassified Sphingopyxis TaxID=2614943 RepID=UPI00073164FD|nr:MULTISPECIES: DNA starvation/stationary phase protection protein [unclassified Sphingopyxis]KTE21561.1 DNA starvation/stationary phase protection protein [Sphingopyxis sp. H057]KTE49558.1 DNA starvation/stationary phase protection protein [Sphingopyxis sp. H073]KTE49785.1 DNA starvation/stationary phase protection protein [Sphingopyxis sp. H071]KTE58184.1 DNA starvation/stationary phase protection protein [Sphingopyxis sp. H107]KTE62668.1 DNA starvation/stationary phase protection protein [
MPDNHNQPAVADALNALLADSFALYLKTKNYHWHVQGPHFRELHLLFDEQATQILGTTDLIAERVRKNGAATLRSIGDVSRRQSIKDDDATSVTADAMVRTLAEDNRTLLAQLKDVKAAAEAEGDIATSGLVDAWADETQQRIWFLEATAGY